MTACLTQVGDVATNAEIPAESQDQQDMLAYDAKQDRVRLIK